MDDRSPLPLSFDASEALSRRLRARKAPTVLSCHPFDLAELHREAKRIYRHLRQLLRQDPLVASAIGTATVDLLLAAFRAYLIQFHRERQVEVSWSQALTRILHGSQARLTFNVQRLPDWGALPPERSFALGLGLWELLAPHFLTVGVWSHELRGEITRNLYDFANFLGFGLARLALDQDLEGGVPQVEDGLFGVPPS